MFFETLRFAASHEELSRARERALVCKLLSEARAKRAGYDSQAHSARALELGYRFDVPTITPYDWQVDRR
jgi:hypothetical protein